MFIFVELFHFIGEQIGFEVLVFGPAGPDIEPGGCSFLSILGFLNFLLVLEAPDFKSRNLSAVFAELVQQDYLLILGYHINCNFFMYVFQIKLKYLCSQPIKWQKFPR